ncbi:hypothetical protein LZG04_40490 [Saccharothrix sp. S26]|uniref:hypothetical protein n=1 Tax=Saccharothrix sp. S26 TaxID=2907215 RepID=UPI001F30F706|nr:hypothetical protein [Saccharothrix sp. S26]MCE7001054.1 hypothetical protein [Saccharothrix sp. S26]
MPWTVKAVPVVLLLLAAGFALDAVTIVHTFANTDEVFALAGTKNDSMDGPLAVMITWVIGACSLAVMVGSAVVLSLAVVGLLGGRRSGRVWALVGVVPHFVYTACSLPRVGWRDRAALNPNDLSAYFDPATTPAFVRFADVAAVPFGFAGAAAALVLLLVPATRHWVNRPAESFDHLVAPGERWSSEPMSAG